MLLPIDLRIDKACHNAITRLATLPHEHPLHTLVKKSTRRQIKRHKSPLHTLTSMFGINPDEIEKIPPVRIHPKNRGLRTICIDIPPSKEESKRADSTAIEQIRVYSDGSAHRGKVGAAAILKRDGKLDHILKLHLGTTKQHTVYEAELVGMIMGLHLIKTERRSKVKSILNVDNQAVLVAIKSNMNKSGQHLAANLLQLAKHLCERRGNSGFKLTFRWSAGHVGIEGNEDADKKAKAAADRDTSEKEELPACLCKKLGHSLSATRQAHNDKLKRRWAATWAESPRYRRAPFQDLLTPYSQKYLKLVSREGISRKTASIIFQLRVGHAPLNQYLHQFKKVDKPHCPACGHLKETAEHFVLNCPKYAHERWPLLRQSGSGTPKFMKILASHKTIGALANYIEATGRFDLKIGNATIHT